MKKFLHLIREFIPLVLFIILLPALIVLALGYLFYVPIDIIRYRRMPYYREQKEKYTFFITNHINVKLYNHIRMHDRPIRYVKNENITYFIKDGTVLLTEWSGTPVSFDGDAVFCMGRSDIRCESVIEDGRCLLCEEDAKREIRILIFYRDYKKGRSKLLHCPYFYCVESYRHL